MDFLQKLDRLLEEHGMNRKEFSEASGIKYSTIGNWYARSYDNMSIETLQKLCDYFNVSMESMVYDELNPTPVEISEDRPVAYPALERKAQDIGMRIVYGFNHQNQPDPPFGEHDIFLRYPDGYMLPITTAVLDDLNDGLDTYLKVEATKLRSRYETTKKQA